MSTLLPPDFNNISLNENAYFYKKKKALSESAIHRIFKEAINDKNGNRRYKSLVRQSYFEGSKEVAKISLDIYDFKQKPSFLKVYEEGKWESKFGMLLIVEYSEYVAIIRKNVSGVKSLGPYLENIDYKVLAYFLTTHLSRFEKIVASNMNIAENALQIKHTEALDLKGILSRFGASKQILNAIRLDNKGSKHSISLNTSRVNSFNLRSDFNIVVDWCISIISLIKRASISLPASSFLDGFAKPINFSDIIKTLNPTFLLLRFNSLKAQIESGEIHRCFTRDTNGKETQFNLIDFVNKQEKLFVLTKVRDRIYSNHDLRVRINNMSITISNDLFKSIQIEYGNKDTYSLNDYFNYGNNYTISFDKIDHIYANGKIFRDSKLLGDTDNFLETFIATPELSDMRSEKGTTFQRTTSQFSQDSLFGFIESKFSNSSEFMLCDDMGREWGDFISVEKDSITFYHAKWRQGALSASDLESVFGQAQKNLGFLELTDELIDSKSTHWLSRFRINNVQTSITRIRKGPSRNKIRELKNLVNKASSNANFRRRVRIVITSLSKRQLASSLKELKKGNYMHRQGVPLQIVWFVNALLCSANETGTELKIFCRP